MQQLKRVNVINKAENKAYRTTVVGANVMVREQGFKFISKSKLQRLVKNDNKEVERNRRNELRLAARKSGKGKSRPFKYRIKDMVKNYFNQN